MHFNDLDRARVFALDAVVVNFDPALDWWFLVAQAGDQRGRHRSCFLLPRQPSRLGRSSLLIQLRLECGLDRRHIQLALHPADYQLRCQVGVWDDVALRLLQADGAIGRTGVGAVVGRHGVVHGEDDAVNRGAVAGGDGPGVGGGHGGVVAVGSGVD